MGFTSCANFFNVRTGSNKVRDLVIDNTLDSFFWAEYADLWHNSKNRSPFQAPGILQFFSQKYTNSVIEIRLIREQSTDPDSKTGDQKKKKIYILF